VKRVHVEVRGQVQGVFFRATCVERARAARVGGWVRNTPDGHVEAVFEGEPDAVEAMVRWCSHGPPLARVDTMDVRDETPTGELDFHVAR